MSAAAARATCTHAWHTLIRANPASFARETVPIGTMDDGDGGTLQLANCRSCGSTLVGEQGARS